MSVITPPTFLGHDGGPYLPAPARTVATWPAGHFAENLAVAQDGTVYVSLHSHNRIDRYRPETGDLEVFCELPAPATGLAFDADGLLWVSGGTVGQGPGYIWRVSSAGGVQQWLQIRDALFLNGCAILAEHHILLVAESLTGRILAVDQHNRTCATWLQDDRLRPTNKQMPGANGMKINGDHVWVSVTDHNTILRVPVRLDGGAGRLELAAKQIRGDDFAFSQGGALYIATHVAQTVLRLGTDGQRTTIAGPHEGAVGSTACAFGRAPADRHGLYVTTNGGLSLPYQGQLQDAKLLRLEVDEDGQPLLSANAPIRQTRDTRERTDAARPPKC